MKRVIATGLLFFGVLLTAPVLQDLAPNLSLVRVAEAAVSVKGYYRKNGTYVQPHMRSNPDGNPYNNWSFPGNTNPYTGKTATGNPDTYLNNYYNRTPSYTAPTYVPTYTPTPSCPIFSSYNSLSKSCTCYTGYYIKNNSCVSIDEICRDKYGFNARSTTGDKCTCGYGYRFNSSGDKCISKEDYCQELDWNAEYDILKDSCVCKDGYKAGITGSSCVRDYDRESTYTPSFSLPSTTYSCPPHSKPDPLDPSSCPCDVGYQVTADKSACVLKSPNPPSECGEHMHKNRGGCICDMGYGLDSSNVSCTFKGCPTGYALTASKTCELQTSTLGKSINCTTRNPCTCPTGYTPMGNRKCVPIK